jgi:hypothetical protein
MVIPVTGGYHGKPTQIRHGLPENLQCPVTNIRIRRVSSSETVVISKCGMQAQASHQGMRITILTLDAVIVLVFPPPPT